MFKLFALIPIINMVLLVVIFNKQGLCRRDSFLYAAVTWGIVLTAITEILSIVHQLNFEWLSTAWIMTILLLVSIYCYIDTHAAPHHKYTLTPFTKLLLCCIVGIVITTGIIAVIAPPNNGDSMTYHMSRVIHWIQNQSVAHYPTNIIRQIESNPWAEYAITHFQILSNGDHLANLVQWFCMIGSILGVTLIAEKLGADHRGQTIAAVFAATIPMGILQSSSTQNDCVVSFWLVCLVYFGIQFNERPCWRYASVVGGSLGLSLLTKGTAYLYAFPLLIWLSIFSLKSIKLRAVKYMALIMVVAISLNIGHYARNYETFGSILSSGELKFSNDSYCTASLISNIIRNVALEMGSQFEYANQVIKSGASLLHASMGLDINSHASTWPGTYFSVYGSRHEDLAGNPFHLLLIIISIISILYSAKLKYRPNLLPYLSALVVGFILFCFYLRWQPWHNRLLLPLIILWSPIIAVCYADVKRLWTINIIVIVIICMAIPFVLLNDSRPLITARSIFTTSRVSQYFNNNRTLMSQYYNIARHLKSINCTNIAIQSGDSSCEYLLWILLQENISTNIRIEHVHVDNKSAIIPLNNFTYCEVVSLVSIDRGIPWIAHYTWGTKLDFSARSPDAELYMIQGWSTPEDWGVWSMGAKAVLGFIAPEPTEDMVLELGDFSVFAKQPVNVLVNGEAVYHFSNFDSAKNISIPVTKAILTRKSPITIEFVTPQSSTPLSHGINDDTRVLGIGLHTLTLTPKKKESPLEFSLLNSLTKMGPSG